MFIGREILHWRLNRALPWPLPKSPKVGKRMARPLFYILVGPSTAITPDLAFTKAWTATPKPSIATDESCQACPSFFRKFPWRSTGLI